MKKLLFICLLFTLAVADPLHLTQSKLQFFIDAHNDYNVSTITAAKKYFKTTNKSFMLTDKALWSYRTIQNDVPYEQKLIVYNALRLLRYADVLIIHQNGEKETFFIGSNRNQELRSLGVIGYPLSIKPNETVKIYTGTVQNSVSIG